MTEEFRQKLWHPDCDCYSSCECCCMCEELDPREAAEENPVTIRAAMQGVEKYLADNDVEFDVEKGLEALKRRFNNEEQP